MGSGDSPDGGDVIGYMFLAFFLFVLFLGVVVVAYRYWRYRRNNHLFVLFDDASRSVSVEVVEDLDAGQGVRGDDADRVHNHQVSAGATEEDALALQPKRTRLALASHFSAQAAMSEATKAASPTSGPHVYHHGIVASEAYIWPSKGGSAVPVSVEWGPQGSPSNSAKPGAKSKPFDDSNDDKDDVQIETFV